MSKSIICPEGRSCSGGTQGRQHDLTPEQIARIMAADPALEEELSAGAQRCGYCGAVYLATKRRTLGWLDNGVHNEGWIPKGERSPKADV
ncbi:hypothetical protein [Marinicauda salina]|uniref:hypothetical protein n=1 Tax=Marinicauda salina TaxID=2135793 RepID=UPI0011B1CC9C|nr:hypothetical protein [Marinicauda salina]